MKLKSENLDTIVVPKVDTPADLHFVVDVIRHLAPSRIPSPQSTTGPASNTRPVHIIGLIESARGLVSLNSICQATPFLTGIAFAAEDFALDLSLIHTPSRSEMAYARSCIVTACRAFEIPSVIGLVNTSFKDAASIEKLGEDCRMGKSFGFTGKQAIHPTQVQTIQNIFGPSKEEVSWAIRVELGNQTAIQEGAGAWQLDGKMIDIPVVLRVNAILRKATLCGVDVEELRVKWKTTQPK